MKAFIQVKVKALTSVLNQFANPIDNVAKPISLNEASTVGTTKPLKWLLWLLILRVINLRKHFTLGGKQHPCIFVHEAE